MWATHVKWENYEEKNYGCERKEKKGEDVGVKVEVNEYRDEWREENR